MTISMSHWSRLLMFLLFVHGSTQQCLSEDDWESSGSTITDVNLLQAGSSEFAIRLFREIATEPSNSADNVLISPISVWAVLVTTTLGARGETASELASALHVNGVSKPDLITAYQQFRDQLLHNATNAANYTFNLANKIFFNENLHISQCIGNTELNAELQSLDFAEHKEESRQFMNDWVENKTNNKIKNLVQPGDVRPDTTMFLVNAAYFKGLWKTKFQYTLDNEDFFVKPDLPIKVNMMRVTGHFRVGDDDALDCSALDLPYSGEEVSMVILLPNTNVEDLIPKLTSESISNLWNSLTNHPIHVRVPEFRVEQTTDLIRYIRNLGVNRMFAPGIADFSGFTGDRGSYVDIIRQKSYIDVNEKGTEAAAATLVRAVFLSGWHTDRAPFICDKPFVYFIRHNTGGILFGGIVRQPVISPRSSSEVFYL